MEHIHNFPDQNHPAKIENRLPIEGSDKYNSDGAKQININKQKAKK